MRAAFGLVGVLLCVGIIAFMMKIWHPADTVRTGEGAKRQVEKIVGVDEHGMKVADSIRLDAITKDGKVRSILVERLVPEGPMAKHFGLMENDLIIKAGPMDMKDQDEEMGKALILDARAKGWNLTVLRDGHTVELPLAPGLSTTGGKAATQDTTNRLRRQLDAIPGIPK